MHATNALQTLKPDAWAATSLEKRLKLLDQIQRNMAQYAEQLAEADGTMKDGLVEQHVFSVGLNLNSTVGLIGGTIAATVDLYQSILRGKPLTAKQITEIGDGTYDIEVYPQTRKDGMTAGRQRGHLRVKGEPRQVDPREGAPGVIAVLGAGNYSASTETVKALFWDNKAVIHKPHPLNAASDAVWQKVFAPLVEIGALAYCDADQSVELTQLPGLTAIYFTGSAATAQAITAATDTPVVAECGGNNPCIVVPGDRPWTDKEIVHQAQQYVSLAKINGGAVCGRAQTLVTSKHWPQRQQFLDAIRKAFVEETPAISSYYPGSGAAKERFAAQYPDAEVLVPEHGRQAASDGLFIVGAEPDGFAAANEAFCQVIAEITLDAPADAEKFLAQAVTYCNNRLLGSLACMIVIDEDTKKAHQAALDTAIDDLRYGAIAVNTIPALLFTNPYLIWGGADRDGEVVSGHGNFGNLLGYANVQKAVLYDQFVSMTHFLYTKKAPFDRLMAANARYTTRPTWLNLTRMVGSATRANMARKDF
ncbi:aldehyde dehydrogenase family protein [Streptomyces fuscichromogenes]|uniref:Aldehyde dehydrogenase n=1 Tax=Streptomyces fuscichromogenes TaxID=1324013 RepID=A0A917XLV5_9ACTN|nr:aldehyde dehydrogenase family protein [Streptomyces fuscichromogenes]GGN39503.1 aldehyde dehydrogenase [Streptomyces fuscichromogenes]